MEKSKKKQKKLAAEIVEKPKVQIVEEPKVQNAEPKAVAKNKPQQTWVTVGTEGWRVRSTQRHTGAWYKEWFAPNSSNAIRTKLQACAQGFPADA